METTPTFSLESLLASIECSHSEMAMIGAKFDNVAPDNLEAEANKIRLVVAEAMISIILSCLNKETKNAIASKLSEEVSVSAPIHGCEAAQIDIIIEYLCRGGMFHGKPDDLKTS